MAKQIFIRGIAGKTVTLDVECDALTVNDLKYALWKRTQVPPPAQRICYGGRQLDDTENLPQHNNATVQFLERMAPQIYVYFAKENRWNSRNLYSHSVPKSLNEARQYFAEKIRVDEDCIDFSKDWLDSSVSVVFVNQ